MSIEIAVAYIAGVASATFAVYVSSRNWFEKKEKKPNFSGIFSEMEETKPVEEIEVQEEVVTDNPILEKIKEKAALFGWTFITWQPANVMVSFRREYPILKKAPVRMNVYITKRSTIKKLAVTVSTSMDHPTKGKKQLHRKGCS